MNQIFSLLGIPSDSVRSDYALDIEALRLSGLRIINDVRAEAGMKRHLRKHK
jgi:hypothetical protein